ASAQSRLDVDSDARSAWNLPADTGRGRGRTVVDFDEILRSAADMVGQYAHSLGAHLTKQEGDDTVNGPVTNVGYLTHSIEAEECVRLFVGNHGIFDVLLRYIGVVLDLLCLSPVARVPQTALKRVLLRTLIMTHEALLDQARNDLGSDSLDSQRRALHRGTAIVMLLTESAAVDTPCREQCACMRLEWKLVLGSAIARLQIPTSDTCVARYYVAEAWTNYEMAVWYNDLSGAAVAIGACYDLIRDLQGLRESLAGPDALLHTLSGVTVTLELVQQRQAHLDSFNKLGEAVRLAQSNESQAIDILSDLADPSANSTACSLVFPQKIAAVRLLAALCRRQSQAAGEVRAIMHELYLYLAQLLARSDDSVLPVRLVLRRCASCLKAIYAMASADGQINRDLESADVGLFGAQLASLLAAMLLALARHFTLDPETDSASTSPEATLVGLAAWLAAKLAFSPGVAFGAGTASRADRQTAADASDSPITQSSCPDDAEVLGPYLSYLDGVHALLGERGLCTAADGAFLKYVLEACRAHISEDTDAPVHWDVAGASLRCLFDIKLYNCKAPRHSSAHIEMDSISANLTYLLVESELLDTLRNRKGAGLRSDLKAIVDQTSSALSDIDATQHPRVAMNMDVIDDYLDGTAMPTFTQIERALRCEHAPVLVACLPPTEPGAGMPAACVTLPFVRATTQHDLLRFRMRSGMARAVEDYDDIIEDYKLHASLHPTSAEAWLHMGQAHSDLADELLLGTAAEIIECRHDIAVLQRAALACVVQAKQLLEPLSIGNDTNSADGMANTEAREQILRLHIRVYSLAGRLTYRIAARPLALLALGVLPSNILVADDDNSYQEWDL
ncbi:Histone transcription regulator 3, partial [Coemansia erecta]